MKKSYKAAAIFGLFVVFNACSNNHDSVKSLSEVNVENQVGYLSFNFSAPKGYYCKGSVTNLSSKKTYQIRFNNPEQPTNTVNILGFEVYKDSVGVPVTIPFSVIPLPPGDYRINNGFVVSKGQTTFRIKSEKQSISIFQGKVTYIGDYTSRVKRLLFLFPIGFDVQRKETDKRRLDSLFSKIPYSTSFVELH